MLFQLDSATLTLSTGCLHLVWPLYLVQIAVLTILMVGLSCWRRTLAQDLTIAGALCPWPCDALTSTSLHSLVAYCFMVFAFMMRALNYSLNSFSGCCCEITRYSIFRYNGAERSEMLSFLVEMAYIRLASSAQ